MTKKIITVEGMHCIHCAGSVEKAVSALDGIKEAKVNLDKKVCTAKLSGEVTDESIKNAIKEAGFEVIGIETKKGLF
ncbi:MAG: heavy-metal-associated domain-containing protein [Clostridia bacterium]|nr:heavy-metal-associated domain-containing protein [Clostridia bacterium]